MDTKKLRQKILDLAIHGKLVPQDPNDEPASVLLERIRAEKERLIAEGKIKRSKKSATSDTPHYENVPFEVPEGWVWVSLSEIAHSCLGKMLDKEKNQGTLLPYLRNVNVRWGSFELEDVLQMPFCEEDDERFSIVQGDLVVCEGGEPGRCAIWEHKESIKFQKALHRIRCFNGALNYYIKNVIEWYASSKNIEKYYTGSTIKHLTGESLSTLQIPLPPIQEQHRIVSIIDQWMSLIGLLDTEFAELKQNIEKTKSRILDLAIKGELVPQDENDEPASELLKRINPKAIVSCDNPHYENVPFVLPSNWVWVKLGDITNYGKCSTCSVDDIGNDSWILELEDIEKDTGKVLVRQTKAEREIKGVRHSFSAGNVLYSKLRTYLNKVLLAKDDGFCTTEIIPIECTDVIYPQYLYYVLRSQYFLDYTAQCGYGVKMPRLSTNDARKAMIPLPPLPEQLKIIEKVESITQGVDCIARALQ